MPLTRRTFAFGATNLIAVATDVVADTAPAAAAFMFDSRASLAAVAGDIADGQLVCVRGIYAVKDATATGMRSALYDLSLDVLQAARRYHLLRLVA